MKKIIIAIVFVSVSFASFAQEKEKDDSEQQADKGFKKQNLFTGGGIDFGLSSYSTELGIAPVFGYSLSKWLDAGVVFNFTYLSEKVVDFYGYTTGEKVRQTDFGPGAFARIYPIDFLFIQGQFEENFIKYTDLPAGGGPSASFNTSAPSLLVGAGYCTGREGGSGAPFFYLSIMADVLANKYSPYVQQNYDGSVSIIPIIRGGIQIPLFQGKQSGSGRYSRRHRDGY